MNRRAGVSLVELMVALGIFSVLIATTLGFYRQQGEAFAEGNSRMTLMQNLRYGVSTLEQNLRTAGVGVPAKQPVLVYAANATIAFNADYATRLADDLFAVYYDPALPAAAVSSLSPSRKITIPGSGFLYPDSAYFAGSGNSPAETITFFFALDGVTERSDDFILYRQVNDQAPDVIARNLLATQRPFFTYLVRNESSTSSVADLPASYLPAAHTVPIHGSPADTGIVAAVDSVRAVRISFAATNGLPGKDEVVREITRLIRLPNAGLDTPRNCGSRPLFDKALLAAAVNPTETTPGSIELSWTAATDETTGEEDVIRYVLWRSTGGGWGDPLISIPAGGTTYSYSDKSVEANVAYSYAVAAQDCTPQYSDLSQAGPVSIAPPPTATAGS